MGVHRALCPVQRNPAPLQPSPLRRLRPISCPLISHRHRQHSCPALGWRRHRPTWSRTRRAAIPPRVLAVLDTMGQVRAPLLLMPTRMSLGCSCCGQRQFQPRSHPPSKPSQAPAPGSLPSIWMLHGITAPRPLPVVACWRLVPSEPPHQGGPWRLRPVDHRCLASVRHLLSSGLPRNSGSSPVS